MIMLCKFKTKKKKKIGKTKKCNQTKFWCVQFTFLLLAAKPHLVFKNILKFVPVMFSIRGFLACDASREKTTL